MKRLILATLAGAIIAFLWGVLSWVVLDWHKTSKFENETAVAASITSHATDTGVYMLPSAKKDGQPDEQAINKGPYIYAIIRPGERATPWSANTAMLISFLTNLTCALLIAITVYRIRAKRFISRASVGLLLGIFAAISTVTPRWNWFDLPMPHLLGEFLDPIIAYGLAGLAIAAIIKSRGPRRIFT